MMEVLVGLTVLLLGFGGGYRLGYRQGCETTAEDWSARMSLLEPPRRQAGLPTNLDGPPAKVVKPRMRQQRRWYP